MTPIDEAAYTEELAFLPPTYRKLEPLGRGKAQKLANCPDLSTRTHYLQPPDRFISRVFS